jgi:hypothetical protein
MKVNKNFIIGVLLISLLSNLIFSLKHKKTKMSNRALLKNRHKTHHKTHHKSKAKSHIGYDPSYSPEVIKDFIKENIDESRDEQKLLNTCLNLIADDSKYEQQRRDLWNYLENFANDEAVFLKYKTIHKFIHSMKALSYINGDPNNKVVCGEYIVNCLKDSNSIEEKSNVDKLRTILRASMGSYSSQIKNNNNLLVTSFASYYRDSEIRSPDLFKRLNSRNQ